MKAKERRTAIINQLKSSETAVSASTLAQQLSVSRQVIVGDIALLRASGLKISATPRGYILEANSTSAFPFIGLAATKHTPEETQEELYTIVDYGGYVLDVMIEHPVYGQLSGPLDIASRHDVDLFVQNLSADRPVQPLSLLTDGVHFHRIGCKSQEAFQLIMKSLEEKGFLYSPEE